VEATVEAGAIITAQELNNKNTSVGPQLVDVRSASEFAGGHLAGALSIPLDQIESRIADLDCHRPVVLVCKTGLRSAIACNLLQQLGKPALVLQGGTAAWELAGFPLVRSAKTRWALERQVRLIAGLLVAAGSLLALAGGRSLGVSVRLRRLGTDVRRPYGFLRHGDCARRKCRGTAPENGLPRPAAARRKPGFPGLRRCYDCRAVRPGAGDATMPAWTSKGLPSSTRTPFIGR
jgi:rhodanese-related sulfurtransferase